MTSRRSVRAACIAVATSLLGIFAAPHMASAAVTVTVTDTGGTVIPRAFVVSVNSQGDAVDAGTTASDGTVSINESGAAGLIVSAPGYQTKTSSSATAQTVQLTATTKSKLTYANTFGGQVRTFAGDGESGVMYATTDAQPSVWRTSDYAGSWAPVPTTADVDSGGLPQETANQIFTSGYPGEVAVTLNSGLYYSRNFGNSWDQISQYQNTVTGSNKRHYWVHAGTSSYLFVKSESGFWGAVMPDTTPTSPITLTSLSSWSAVTNTDIVNFAPAGSGNNVFMVVAGTGGVKVYSLTAGATSIGSVSASLSSTVSGLSITTTSSANDLVFLGTLNDTAPRAVMVYDIESGSGVIRVATDANKDGTWDTNSGGMKSAAADNANWGTLSTITSIGNAGYSQCGENGTSTVGSLAPRPPAGALSNMALVGTIRQCFFVFNAAGSTQTVGSNNVDANTVVVMPMQGSNNNTGFVWDSGFDFTSTNMVTLTGDGQFGLRKSAVIDSTSSFRPNFSGAGQTGADAYVNNVATSGTGSGSGGIAVNGMSAPNITDMAYSPNSTNGQRLVVSTTGTGGSRTMLSTDGGTSFSTIGAGGSQAVDWWNGADSKQHIAAGFTNDAKNNFLQVKAFIDQDGAGALQMGEEIAATAANRDLKNSTTYDFTFPNTALNPSSSCLGIHSFVYIASITSCASGGENPSGSGELSAIEGIAGYDKMLVAVNKSSGGGGGGSSSSGGSLALVSFTTASSGVSTISEAKFFGDNLAAAGVATSNATTRFGSTIETSYSGAVKGIQYCPTGSVNRVADTAFVAVTGKGVYKITGLSGASQSHSGPIASGSYSDLKVDCDTGLMVGAGSDGMYFSLDGTTFTKINTAAAAPAPGPGPGGQGGSATAVAVQADATSGEVVMSVASGNGDIKAVETNFAVLGTTGADMVKDGTGPKTPAAAVSPPTDAVNELNSSSTGKNTGSVQDLEVPPAATDKVNKAGVRVFSVRAMATSLSLAAGTGGGAFKARVNSGGSSTSSGGSSSGGSTATTTPTATTVTPVVVKTPTVLKGKTLTVVSALTTAGTTVVKGSKTSVVVATASKKICSATSTTIKGLVAGTCSLTVTVTPAKVTKTTNTTVTKGQSLTIASIASTNKLPSTTNATVAVTVSAGSKRVCTVSANKTVKAIGSGKCTLTISVTGKKFTKKLLVKVS